MSANDLFKAGRLQEAIDAQIQEVKANPADANRRFFLFELATFAGDLDRARRQLDAVKYDDEDRNTTVQSYRKLLESEELRRRLFRDGVQPLFLVDPPEHVHLRLDALNRLREGNQAEALKLLEKANEGIHLTGQLNNKLFTQLRDGDDVFGTVLEVMAHGNYFWVPLDQIETLAMNPPRAPRDLIWIPAHLEMGGSVGEVYLSALYPGSHEHADDAVRLGRSTDWKQAEGGPVQGVGLRTFLVDDDAVDLLQWREFFLTEEEEKPSEESGEHSKS